MRASKIRVPALPSSQGRLEIMNPSCVPYAKRSDIGGRRSVMVDVVGWWWHDELMKYSDAMQWDVAVACGCGMMSRWDVVM